MKIIMVIANGVFSFVLKNIARHVHLDKKLHRVAYEVNL